MKRVRSDNFLYKLEHASRSNATASIATRQSHLYRAGTGANELNGQGEKEIVTREVEVDITSSQCCFVTRLEDQLDKPKVVSFQAMHSRS